MFRTQNKLPNETKKEEPTLIFRSEWPACFGNVVVFPDGKHLIGTAEPGERALQIWNIETKTCVWMASFIVPIHAMTLIKNNELIIVSDSHIHHLTINMQAQSFLHKPLGVIAIQKNIISIMPLKNELLAIGCRDGSVEILDLISRKKTETIDVGATKINAMDTRQDGCLVLANETGNIYIRDKENYIDWTKYCFGTTYIESLLVLPDNTIVFGDSDGYLRHWDCGALEILSFQKISDSSFKLISMPNGWIGCLTTGSLKFFEPSWTRDYVNVPKTKEILETYLPKALTEIVISYSTVSTLFNAPKMPCEIERVLEKQLTVSPGIRHE